VGTMVDCRRISFTVFCRPHMYRSAAAKTRTANPPIATPAIAPAERGGDFDAATVICGATVPVGVVV